MHRPVTRESAGGGEAPPRKNFASPGKMENVLDIF